VSRTYISCCVSFALICGGIALADAGDDAFNFATGLFIEADYELAADEYKSFLEDFPNHARVHDARFQLAECMMRLERFDDAIPVFRHVVNDAKVDDDKLAAAYIRLGRACNGVEQFAAGAEYYKLFLRKFPEHDHAPAARYWAGELLLRAENFDAARQAFEAAVQANKDTRYESFSIYGLGCALNARGSHAEAAANFEQLLRRFPEEEFSADAALRLGQCLNSLARYDEALKVFDDMRRKHPDKLQAESLMGSAWANYHAGNHEEAARIFNAVAAQFPEHALAAAAAYNAASALFNQKKYEQALEKFSALVQDDGDQAIASTYWTGMCLLELDRTQQALEIFTKLAQAESEHRPAAIFGMAESLRKLAKLEEAQQTYERVAGEFPKHRLADDALQAAAAVAAEQGSFDEAVEFAGRLLREYSDSPLKPLARFQRADALFYRGENARPMDAASIRTAKNELQALLPEEQDSVSRDKIIYKIGWCELRLAEPAAADTFLRLAEEYPDSPLAAHSLYMAGKLYFDNKQFDRAREILQRCEKDFPEEHSAEQAAFALAVLAFNENRIADACVLFERFIAKYSDDTMLAEASFYRGECLFALEDYDAAAAAYQVILEKYPSSPLAPRAACGIGWCAREKGEFEEAAGIFAGVAAKYPDDTIAAEAAYRAARTMIDAKRWDKARDFLTAAAKVKGSDAFAEEIAYYKAHCVLQQGDYETAGKQLDEFLKKYENSALRHHAIYDLAWVYLNAQQPEKAIAAFERVAKETGDEYLKADALFRLGEHHYDAGAYEQAAAAYLQVTELDAAESFLDKVYYKLGWSLEHLARNDEALDCYSKAARLASGGEFAAEAAFRAGLALARAGKHEQALNFFTKTAAAPEVPRELAARAQFQQAESLRAMKRWTQALEAYQPLLKEDTAFQPAYNAHYGSGVCSLEIGALEDARDAFSAVIRQTETATAAMAQMGLGEILVRQGEHARAAREFLKVYILYGYPEWKAKGLLRAAQSFKEAGDRERAVQYLTQLLENFPNTEQARAAAKMLAGD